MQPSRSFGLCAFIGLLSASLSDAYSFLFVSAPSSGVVYASRLLTAVEQSRNDKMESKKLVGLSGINEPRGLAVDSLRKILYVIDGNGGNGNGVLHAARIYRSKDGHIACEAPKKIAEGLSSNWVSVDFRGKVFFAAGNQILSLPVSSITRKLDGSLFLITDSKEEEPVKADAENADDVVKKAEPAVDKKMEKDEDLEVVYNGAAVTGVSMPRGIAVDGHRIFWTNGENGEQDGTVVQGLEDPMGDTKVTPLATNLAMAHGICLTSSRIFYTDEESNVFTTKVNGGPATAVTEKLQKPRGCVFDGDGTVFIADAGDDKVVSFAGAAAELGPRRMSVSLSNIKEPFALAVLHGNRDHLDSGASRSAAMTVAFLASLLSMLL